MHSYSQSYEPKHVGVIFNFVSFKIFTTQILTSKFYIIEYISQLIKVLKPVLIFLIIRKNSDCFPIQESLGFSILEIFNVYSEVRSNILYIIQMH